jgi:hypothetical protein
MPNKLSSLSGRGNGPSQGSPCKIRSNSEKTALYLHAHISSWSGIRAHEHRIRSVQTVLSSDLTASVFGNYYTVAYRHIDKRWLCKQRPLLGNALNMHATIELCFLCGPCQDVITERFRSQSIYSQLYTRNCEERTWALSYCWNRYWETSSNRLRTIECVL